MTEMPTDAYIDHAARCPVCWLMRELSFPETEYSTMPEDLEVGLDRMMGSTSWETFQRAVAEPWWDHGVGPEDAERLADTAQFVAVWRNTRYRPSRWTAGVWPVRPVAEELRPRVARYMEAAG